ncbi:hypothetical protein ACFSCX_16495 [Bacillus salitolerans]|uniref:DUF3951 domain-containing protein n=1 Tax=Bacillus salitolerans TaxID=1437434 RepID=A0ABW4LU05_9BACI
MTYIFLIFIIAIITFVTIRTMKNKKFPSNNYTPYDDFVSGKNDDSNHITHYHEEKK